jgi:hypothetical protein
MEAGHQTQIVRYTPRRASHRASPYPKHDASRYRLDLPILNGTRDPTRNPGGNEEKTTWSTPATPSDSALGSTARSTGGNIRRDIRFHELNSIVPIRRRRRDSGCTPYNNAAPSRKMQLTSICGSASPGLTSTQAPLTGTRMLDLQSSHCNISTGSTIAHSERQVTSISLIGQNFDSRDGVHPKLENEPVWWNLIYARPPGFALGWDETDHSRVDGTRNSPIMEQKRL